MASQPCSEPNGASVSSFLEDNRRLALGMDKVTTSNRGESRKRMESDAGASSLETNRRTGVVGQRLSASTKAHKIKVSSGSADLYSALFLQLGTEQCSTQMGKNHGWDDRLSLLPINEKPEINVSGSVRQELRAAEGPLGHGWSCRGHQWKKGEWKNLTTLGISWATTPQRYPTWSGSIWRELLATFLIPLSRLSRLPLMLYGHDVLLYRISINSLSVARNGLMSFKSMSALAVGCPECCTNMELWCCDEGLKLICKETRQSTSSEGILSLTHLEPHPSVLASDVLAQSDYLSASSSAPLPRPGHISSSPAIQLRLALEPLPTYVWLSLQSHTFTGYLTNSLYLFQISHPPAPGQNNKSPTLVTLLLRASCTNVASHSSLSGPRVRQPSEVADLAGSGLVSYPLNCNVPADAADPGFSLLPPSLPVGARSAAGSSYDCAGPRMAMPPGGSVAAKMSVYSFTCSLRAACCSTRNSHNVVLHIVEARSGSSS
ncbi:hypothetical protein V8F20_011644 [Naviculisporaceae sp. PSN 640]